MRENFSDIIHFYISTTSLDVFLKCLSNHLKNGFLDHLTVSSEFSLMVDETTNIADWAELAIFVHYVDSDRHSITEKFVSLLDIEKICEIFKEKEVDVEVEVDVQTLPPPFPAERGGAHSVVFVYLIPKHKCLNEVDASIMTVWKLMNYSSVKAAEGQKNLKLLKNGYFTEMHQRVSYLAWNHTLVLQIQLLTIKVNLKSKEYKTSSWNQIACFFYCYLPIFWCISTGSQCIFRIPLTCHLQNKNTQEMCQDYHKKSWHTSFFTVIFRLPCVFYGPYYRD